MRNFISILGVERKIDCSGLIIDWNSSENEATILTSAKLLWNEKNSTLEFHVKFFLNDSYLLFNLLPFNNFYI